MMWIEISGPSSVPLVTDKGNGLPESHNRSARRIAIDSDFDSYSANCPIQVSLRDLPYRFNGERKRFIMGGFVTLATWYLPFLAELYADLEIVP
jgi:hypothetical protein